MANLTDIERQGLVELGVDICSGKTKANFSTKQNKDTFYEGILAAAGGKNFNLGSAIRGEYNECFKIVEEIIDVKVAEGLKGNEFFMKMVETRNIDEGDDNKFWIPDKSFYYVSDMARGNTSVNRQRIKSGTYQDINPTMHGIRVWEHMERLISGRSDMSKIVEDLNKAVTKKKLDDIYNAFINIPLDNNAYRPAAGSYSESKLLEVITHLEAQTEQKVTIMGTKAALRNLNVAIPANMSDEAKSDLYKMGYYGNFYGTECMALSQIHQTNTSTFLLDDKAVYLFAGDTKPIKHVAKGSPLIVPKAYIDQADFTEEYFLGVNYGIGVIISDEFGIYKWA